ncbi:hypothetical protein [Clostridium neonatale]|uniref:hypothetical protein n=1 Tax=Clostridium neonatale TaxID=137838 RepID=UPI00291B5AAD|nr:hypothetical protein [Clostridium neonatale]CAI3206534.1 conserved hypothetical protein [Clostridium neonatale]CAI3210647.1 conserved hypothetical protein [Clostridium neonatale]CAI3676652.1 conserved hypothetical protein [Clostridium neonatale]
MNKDKDFFEALKNLLNGNEIIYVSTPINTGEKFLRWYKSTGKKLLKENDEKYNNEKVKNVIEPNIAYARKYVNYLRNSSNKVVIDPTTFESKTLKWSQDDFYSFWANVIKQLANEVIFLDGWEYSIGCCYELLAALENNINVYSEDKNSLTIEKCIEKMNNSISAYEFNNLEQHTKIRAILQRVQEYYENNYSSSRYKYEAEEMKDEKLNNLINKKDTNIAQFVSFEPNLTLKTRFIHINNFDNSQELSSKQLIEKLILSAPSKAVNIRSFSKKSMKGNKFVYNKGINDIEEILNIIKENSLKNQYSIVNENIDINDCGVSGVVLGDVIEFSPEDTPKCVEKQGVCSLPKEIGFKILKNVYGFVPDIKFSSNYRVEFSIHPNRQGVKKEHTIIWEYEYYNKVDYQRKISWPNNFSKFIGDKVFGLLVADALGIRVPRSTVISRKIAPFSFGIETGLKEKWIRTCPIKKEPGKFYTGSSWIDPFELMYREEAKGSNKVNIASLISQDGVDSIYSGACLIRSDKKNDLIEGVCGQGDKFMVGEESNKELPEKVITEVMSLNNQIRKYHSILGDVSIEWVYDGEYVWLVQLNQLKNEDGYNVTEQKIIVSGNPSYYKKVFVKDGLDSLRNKINEIKGKNIGIELIGNIGVTSHFGDLLRLSNIPSILNFEE